MKKYTQTFGEFLNEDENSKEQKDLMRVIKTMKKNRDSFRRVLNDKDEEILTDAMRKDLSDRIEQLDHLILQNSQYITGKKEKLGKRPRYW